MSLTNTASLCTLEVMEDVFVQCSSAPQKRKQETMTPYTREQEQTDYLSRRLSDNADTKRSELKVQFGLSGGEAPKTIEEAVARIKDGKFEVPEGNANMHSAYLGQFITWKDPTVKKDQKGFDAAIKALYTEKTKAKDIIVTGTAAEGLAALQAFEAKTFH